MANNLDKNMQARLDAFREKVKSGKVTTTVPTKKKQPPYVGQKDYGDDLRDYQKKDEDAWDSEFRNNPIYEGYR